VVRLLNTGLKTLHHSLMLTCDSHMCVCRDGWFEDD